MGKIAGYPMQPIKRRTVVFGRSLDAPRDGAVLGCGHVVIRPPSELDRLVGKIVQCYACPKEERPEAPEPPPQAAQAQAVDLTPLVGLIREIGEKLDAMDKRLTQVEDLKTAPEAAPEGKAE